MEGEKHSYFILTRGLIFKDLEDFRDKFVISALCTKDLRAKLTTKDLLGVCVCVCIFSTTLVGPMICSHNPEQHSTTMKFKLQAK